MMVIDNTKMPYTIEVENSECAHCHHGGIWQILGPNDVALGIGFGDKEEAEQWADELSRAYIAGAQAALKTLMADRTDAAMSTLSKESE